MILFLFSLLNLSQAYINMNNNWNPYSWKEKTFYQNIKYIDNKKLLKVENELSNVFPLIYSGEADNLKKDLIDAQKGNSFVLMGGDCAESFSDHNINHYINSYRIILQMTLIFMNNLGKPVVKIGRMAGQYAKPRSSLYEVVENNLTIPSYRGDIINDYEPSSLKREYNPDKMLEAYYKSCQTMNLLRCLSEGGYANIERIYDWNLKFTKEEIQTKYEILSKNVLNSLNFIKASGLKNTEDFEKAKFYAAHEALLLNYEAALTRKDSISNRYYGCSGHMLWIGERTRQLDGAHVEYMRGISNPIGIKISDKCSGDELIKLIEILNPKNEPGKISLISRMGKNLWSKLPELIKEIKNNRKRVTWICDPMHGNTKTSVCGLKTRSMDDIFLEITTFYTILKLNDVNFGGIHLEMTGEDVTECIDFSNINDQLNLEDNYKSLCDPRLNADQCLQLAFELCDYINESKK